MGGPRGIDALRVLKQFLPVSTLTEIQKAAQQLPPQQKRELMLFLGAELQSASEGVVPRNLQPAERAADLQCWAAAHEPGPGLPDWAVGRDAIYD